jgi:hypothetical protein
MSQGSGWTAGLVVAAMLVVASLPAGAQTNWATGSTASTEATGSTSSTGSTANVVRILPQGWSAADRDRFYTIGQGSRLMPYTWFKALRRIDVDAPFGADRLQRYGYLRYDSPRSVEGLPMGFVVQGSRDLGDLGMTCAACHTAAISYRKDNVQYELLVDGAPANVDFHQFLVDLTAAVRLTFRDSARFTAFAKTVLGADYSAAAEDALRVEFGRWVTQFGDFMDRSLPRAPWGPGRLDAFGMIFNRVTAKDMGIVENYAVADAPVSYPFLWNAGRQDRTQWTGSVPNGRYIPALGRNGGEVLGVFGDLRPKLVTPLLAELNRLFGWKIDVTVDLSENSIDFEGLQALEELMDTLKPPPWPVDVFGPLDATRVARGGTLFQANCAGCHGPTPSPKTPGTWRTPIVDVGTDPRAAKNACREVKSGVFEGAGLLAKMKEDVTARIGPRARASDILSEVALGVIIGGAIDAAKNGTVEQSGVWRGLTKDLRTDAGTQAGQLASTHDRSQIEEKLVSSLNGLYKVPDLCPPAYEARGLLGVWATAPYLHNGSVPTLWELLTPPGQRKTTFAVGSRDYDPTHVGYVTDRAPAGAAPFVADPRIGNGNGGHDFGTGLPEEDRWSLVEYLKSI